jgi:type III secretion protein U
VLAAAGIAGAVVHVVQTGGVIASKRLTPKLDRLNVFEGLKNLFSTTRLVAVARAFLGGAAVAWLAYRALVDHATDLARLAEGAPGARLAYGAALTSELARGLARDAAMVGLALAAIDIVATRRAWLARLRMSKDEVKREYKESEGDPQMKAARERAHKEMIAQATVANVRTASVVIVNPTHLATALRYDEKEGDEAPVVVASGDGDLAARIVRAAHDYGIPVVRDVPLARALAELEVGDAIPEALYEAVAEILRDAMEAEQR